MKMLTTMQRRLMHASVASLTLFHGLNYFKWTIAIIVTLLTTVSSSSAGDLKVAIPAIRITPGNFGDSTNLSNSLLGPNGTTGVVLPIAIPVSLPLLKKVAFPPCPPLVAQSLKDSLGIAKFWNLWNTTHAQDAGLTTSGNQSKISEINAPCTIFAIEDNGFKEYPQLYPHLEANPLAAREFLSNHIVIGPVPLANLNKPLTTSGGLLLKPTHKGDAMYINDIKVGKDNIELTTGGNVYVVTRPLCCTSVTQLSRPLVDALLNASIPNNFHALDDTWDRPSISYIRKGHLMPTNYTVQARRLTLGHSDENNRTGINRYVYRSPADVIPIGGPTSQYGPTNDSVMHVIPGLSGTTFLTLLQLADCRVPLSRKDPVTIFLPSDEAISNLPPKDLKILVANPDRLKQTLLYHIAPGTYTSDVFSGNKSITTIEGQSLHTDSISNGTLKTVEGAKVILSDIIGHNGVIHVIDRFLYPIPNGTLLDTLEKLPNLKRFLDLLKRVNLTDLLRGEEPYTVFAPTNEALSNISTSIPSTPEGNDKLRVILLNHLVPGIAYTASWSPAQMLPTVGKHIVYLQYEPNESGGFSLLPNGATVSKSDIGATNGVIHILNDVMPVDYLPTPQTPRRTFWQNIWDTVLGLVGSAKPDVTTPPTKPPKPIEDDLVATLKKLPNAKNLLDALNVTGLLPKLQKNGPYTIFVPVNSAFEHLRKPFLDFVDQNRTVAEKILLNHIVPNELLCDELKKIKSANTLEGKQLIISPSEAGCAKVDNTEIIYWNITAKDGVIHLIDKVIFLDELPEELMPSTSEVPFYSTSEETTEQYTTSVVTEEGPPSITTEESVPFATSTIETVPTVQLTTETTEAHVSSITPTVEGVTGVVTEISTITSSEEGISTVIATQESVTPVTTELPTSTTSEETVPSIIYTTETVANVSEEIITSSALPPQRFEPGYGLLPDEEDVNISTTVLPSGRGVSDLYPTSELPVLYLPENVSDMIVPRPSVNFTTITPVTPTTLLDLLKQLNTTKFPNLLNNTELDKALTIQEPLTIFVPTDEAFKNVDNATLNKIMSDPEQLRRVLLYHVIPTRITGNDLPRALQAGTLAGVPVFITVYVINKKPTPLVNNATILPVQHESDNTIVFLIDKVLTSPPEGDIFTTISKFLKEETTKDHIIKARLDPVLTGPGPLTMFVPTENAWNKLPQNVKEQLATNITALKEYIFGHIVGGAIFTPVMTEGSQFKTLNGKTLTVTHVNGGIRVNNGLIIQPDIVATNGVIHVIDNVFPIEEFPSEITTLTTESEPSTAATPPIEKTIYTAESVTSKGQEVSTEQATEATATEEVETTTEAEVEGTTETKTTSEVETTTKTETTPEAEVEATTKLTSEAEIETTTKTETTTEAEVEATTKSTSEAEIETTTKTETTTTEAEVEATTQTETTPEAEVEATTETTPETEVSTTAETEISTTEAEVSTTIESSTKVPAENVTSEPTVTEVTTEQILPLLVVLRKHGLTKLAEYLDTIYAPKILNLYGLFTLFAPTNEAFTSLPPEELKQLEIDPQALQQMLLYHAISRLLPYKDITDGLEIPSIQGSNLTFNVYDNGRVKTVLGIEILRPDIQVMDGIIHVIGKLLYPIPRTTTLQTVDEQFPSFSSAINDSVNRHQLKGKEVTAFIPSEEFWARMPHELREDVFSNVSLLNDIAMNHICDGQIFKIGIKDGANCTTLSGNTLEFTVVGDDYYVNSVPIIRFDLINTDGIIHVIESPLFLDIVLPEGEIIGVIPPRPTRPRPPTRIPAHTSPVSTEYTEPTVTWKVFSDTERTTLHEVSTETTEEYTETSTYHATPEVEEITETPTTTSTSTAIAETSTSAEEYTTPIPEITNATETSVSLAEEVTTTIISTTYVRTENETEIATTEIPAYTTKVTGTVTPTDHATEITVPVTTTEQPVIPAYTPVPNDTIPSILKHQFEDAGYDIDVNELNATLPDSVRYTAFFPNSIYLQGLPTDILRDLITNKTAIRDVFVNHICPGTIYSQTFTNGISCTTVGGKPLVVTVVNGNYYANNFPIIQVDIPAIDGVVHLINGIISVDYIRATPIPSFEHTFNATTEYVERTTEATLAPRVHKTTTESAEYSTTSEVTTSTAELSTIALEETTTDEATTSTEHKTTQETTTYTASTKEAPESEILTTVTETALIPELNTTQVTTIYSESTDNITSTSEVYTTAAETVTYPETTEKTTETTQYAEEPKETTLKPSVYETTELSAKYPNVTEHSTTEHTTVEIIASEATEVPTEYPSTTYSSTEHATEASTLAPNETILSTFKAQFQEVGYDINITDLANDIPDTQLYTAFLPYSIYLQGLPSQVLQDFVKNNSAVRDVFINHVCAGATYSTQFSGGFTCNAISGKPISITHQNGKYYCNNLPIIRVDIPALDGVIHLINGFLIFEPQITSSTTEGYTTATSNVTTVQTTDKTTPVTSKARAFPTEETLVTTSTPGTSTTEEIESTTEIEGVTIVVNATMPVEAQVTEHVTTITAINQTEITEEYSTIAGTTEVGTSTIYYEAGTSLPTSTQHTVAENATEPSTIEYIATEKTETPESSTQSEAVTITPEIYTTEAVTEELTTASEHPIAVDVTTELENITYKTTEVVTSTATTRVPTVTSEYLSTTEFVLSSEAPEYQTSEEPQTSTIYESATSSTTPAHAVVGNETTEVSTSTITYPTPAPYETIMSAIKQLFESAGYDIDITHLNETLPDTQKYTAFLPNSHYLKGLPTDTLQDLVTNKTAVKDVFVNNICPDLIYSSEFHNGFTCTSVGGKPLVVTIINGKYYSNDFPIVQVDLPAADGVIHLLNGILYFEHVSVTPPPKEEITVSVTQNYTEATTQTTAGYEAYTTIASSTEYQEVSTSTEYPTTFTTVESTSTFPEATENITTPESYTPLSGTSLLPSEVTTQSAETELTESTKTTTVPENYTTTQSTVAYTEETSTSEALETTTLPSRENVTEASTAAEYTTVEGTTEQPEVSSEIPREPKEYATHKTTTNISETTETIHTEVYSTTEETSTNYTRTPTELTTETTPESSTPENYTTESITPTTTPVESTTVEVSTPSPNETIPSIIKHQFEEAGYDIDVRTLVPKLPPTQLYTLFLPYFIYLRGLPSDTIQGLVNNETTVAETFVDHICPGAIYSSLFTNGFTCNSIGGNPIVITTSNGRYYTNGFPIIRVDIPIADGVIHLLEGLLSHEHDGITPPTTEVPADRSSTITEQKTISTERYTTTPFTTAVEETTLAPEEYTYAVETSTLPSSTKKSITETEYTTEEATSAMSTEHSTVPSEVYTTVTVIEHSTKSPVVHETQTELVTGSETTELVTGTETIELVTGTETTELVTGTETTKSITGTETESVTGIETTELVTGIETTELVTGTETTESVTSTETTEIPLEYSTVGIRQLSPNITIPSVLKQQFSRVGYQIDTTDFEHRLPSGRVYTACLPYNNYLLGIPPAVIYELINNKTFVSDLFVNHVCNGALYSAQFGPGNSCISLGGKQINIRKYNGKYYCNNFPIVQTDIPTVDGVVHLINGLLFLENAGITPVPEITNATTAYTSEGTTELPKNVTTKMTETTESETTTTTESITRPSRVLNITEQAENYTQTSEVTEITTEYEPVTGTVTIISTETVTETTPEEEIETTTESIVTERTPYHAITPKIVNATEEEVTTSTTYSPVSENVTTLSYTTQVPEEVTRTEVNATEEAITTEIIQPEDYTTVEPYIPTSNKTIPALIEIQFSKAGYDIDVSDISSRLPDRYLYTAFIPHFTVVDRLPATTIQDIIKNKTAVGDVFADHICPEATYSLQFANGFQCTSIGGKPIIITQRNGTYYVNDIPIIQVDIPALDGVVHLINGFLFFEPRVTTETVEEHTTIAGPTTTTQQSEITDLTTVTSGTPKSRAFPTEETTETTSQPSVTVTTTEELSSATPEVTKYETTTEIEGVTVVANATMQVEAQVTEKVTEPYEEVTTTIETTEYSTSTEITNKTEISTTVTGTSLTPETYTTEAKTEYSVITENVTTAAGVTTVGTATYPEILEETTETGETSTTETAEISTTETAESTTIFPQNETILSAFETQFQNSGYDIDVTELSREIPDTQLYTAFLPYSVYLQSLPSQLLRNVVNNNSAIRDVFVNHVCPGVTYSPQFTNGFTCNALSGKPIYVTHENGQFYSNGFPIIRVDIPALDGVIHLINGFLIFEPQVVSSTTEEQTTTIETSTQHPEDKENATITSETPEARAFPTEKETKVSTTEEAVLFNVTTPVEAHVTENVTTPYKEETTIYEEVTKTYENVTTTYKESTTVTEEPSITTEEPQSTTEYSGVTEAISSSTVHIENATLYTSTEYPILENATKLSTIKYAAETEETTTSRIYYTPETSTEKITTTEALESGTAQTVTETELETSTESLNVTTTPSDEYETTARIPMTTVSYTIPSPNDTIPSVIEKQFEDAGHRIDITDLNATLPDTQHYTAFLPYSIYLQGLPTDVIQELVTNKTAVRDVFIDHICIGATLSRDFGNHFTCDAIGGQPLIVSIVNGKYYLNNYPIVQVDIPAADGVIHLLSGILHYDKYGVTPPPLEHTTTTTHITTEYPEVTSEGLTTESIAETTEVVEYTSTTEEVSEVTYSAPPADEITPSTTPYLNVTQEPVTTTSYPQRPVNVSIITTTEHAEETTEVETTTARYEETTSTEVTSSVREHELTTETAVTEHEVTSTSRYPDIFNITTEVGNATEVTSVSTLLPTSTTYPETTEVTTIPFYPASEGRGLLSVSVFFYLVDLSDVDEILSHGGPYTILAPVDSAFSGLPPQVMRKLEDEPTFLKEVILYHILPNKIQSTDLENDNLITTLQGQDVRCNIYGPVITIGGARVILPDSDSGYGVLHIVNKVLYPLPNGTALDTIQPRNDTDRVQNLIRNTTLPKRLQEPGAYTVFIPSDRALNTLPTSVIDALEKNSSLLEEFVLNHMVNGTYYTEGMGEGLELTSMGGQLLRISMAGGLTVNGVPIVTPDISVTNGVVHIIDRILYNPIESITIEKTEPVDRNDLNVVELSKQLNLTTFTNLLSVSGLSVNLSEPGPFTLFAPTNEAFAEMPPAQLEGIQSNPEKLEQLLLYHILPVRLYTTHVTNELLVPSLVPAKSVRMNIYVNNRGPWYTASGSQILQPNNVASNGIVHVVHQVLYIPLGDIVQTVEKCSILQTLRHIITVSGLTDDIRVGNYTLFAPNDGAFNKLPEDVLQRLLVDPTTAKAFLLGHLLRGTINTEGIFDESTMTTVSNNDIYVRALKDCILLNSAAIQYPDVTADNGVVHVIDRVLQVNY